MSAAIAPGTPEKLLEIAANLDVLCPAAAGQLRRAAGLARVQMLHDALPTGSEWRHLLDADDTRYAALAPAVEIGVAA